MVSDFNFPRRVKVRVRRGTSPVTTMRKHEVMNNSPGFLAEDGLLPSHLPLLPSSPPPPLADLRPGRSLLFSVEADTEVTLRPGWDQQLEVQVSFTDSGGKEEQIMPQPITRTS